MFPKKINIKKSKNYPLERFKNLEECKVSKASKEIMLDRFYDGKKIEFPFSK